MEVRTLRPDEREAFLGLLDGWPMDEPWTGREFFRRYVEDDPTYEDRNVWVAAHPQDGLVSCVHIFPRRLRLWGGAVSCGGIGSVFTRPDHRRCGLAERLLAAAAGAMTERGMEVSVLFAGRIAWYTQLGWRLLLRERTLLDPPQRLASVPADLRTRAVDFSTDLPALTAMARSSELPDGRVARDDDQWRASLFLAGDPDEDFRVVTRQGDLVGYARFSFVEGRWCITEWGRLGRPAQALAALMVELTAGRKGVALGFCDESLLGELELRGARLRTETDPDMMVRCLAPEAVARRLGVAPGGEVEMSDSLVADLASRPFCFWLADRF